MRPILVGEDNPYSRDPRYALYGEPENSAGGRLCRVILGLGLKEYVRDYTRVNLCSGKWSKKQAHQTAQTLLTQNKGATFVLLGKKVADAFGFAFAPFLSITDDFGKYVMLPHPSGRNRLWNDPEAIEKARQALREVGALAVKEIAA